MSLMDRAMFRENLAGGADAGLRAAFLTAMSRTTTAVTVVTTDGIVGRFGQTVSAVASVSADPPVLLACLYARTPVAEAIHANGCFAVNVLADDQRELSDIFAGRGSPTCRYVFDAQWCTSRTGSPVRGDAAAVFDADLGHTAVIGTHAVFFGRVRSVRSNDVDGLTYRGRAYGTHRTRSG